ncbi:hypothetical protein [Candidatus Poriferisodalis sp.]|uniref:hypothetical protein n=1 Tax=Candidatus Poriferisodalis sp. TaxID=3101277 RepID=UPI003B01D232
MVQVPFLGSTVELRYPSTRADVERIVAVQMAQPEIKKGDRTDERLPELMASQVEVAATCISICDTDGHDPEHWFAKLYENAHLNGEGPTDCELAVTAQKMCGLRRTTIDGSDLGKEGQGSKSVAE